MEDALPAAMRFARAYAEAGLRTCPFDAVCKAILNQLDLVAARLRADGTLHSLPPDSINLGIMAAKELGNDERDVAHALHVVQRHADAAMARW